MCLHVQASRAAMPLLEQGPICSTVHSIFVCRMQAVMAW